MNAVLRVLTAAEIDALACDFYVDWCKDTSLSDESAARRRWAKMPDFGKRAFVSLAHVAVLHFATRAIGAEERAALRTVGFDRCRCGRVGTLNAAGLCMACASREAE